MSLATSTAAQREELVAACNMLSIYCHKLSEDGSLDTSNTALLAAYQVYLDRVSAALLAITPAS